MPLPPNSAGRLAASLIRAEKTRGPVRLHDTGARWGPSEQASGHGNGARSRVRSSMSTHPTREHASTVISRSRARNSSARSAACNATRYQISFHGS